MVLSYIATRGRRAEPAQKLGRAILIFAAVAGMGCKYHRLWALRGLPEMLLPAHIAGLVVQRSRKHAIRRAVGECVHLPRIAAQVKARAITPAGAGACHQLTRQVGANLPDQIGHPVASGQRQQTCGAVLAIESSHTPGQAL